MMLETIERRLEEAKARQQQPGYVAPTRAQARRDRERELAREVLAQAIELAKENWAGPVTAIKLGNEIKSRMVAIRMKHKLPSLKATLRFLILRGLELEEGGR